MLAAIGVTALLCGGGFLAWRKIRTAQPASPQFYAMQAVASAPGVTNLSLKSLPDGGVLLAGRLAGRQFSARIPSNWNHQAAVFAHGYTIPGSSTAIAADPFSENSVGLFPSLYARGFAVAESAFDKSGIGVESGAVNTLRLRDYVAHLGATRIYLTGASLGGNITMALIEQHSHAFAGALSACGVVDGWTSQIGFLVDVRAAYNYFTLGTPYELPGNKDLAHDALSPIPPRLLGFTGPLYRAAQIKRMSRPILALFAAARVHPDGLEAHIIRDVAAASGTSPEVASFLFPLVTVGLGMDDINQTYGGLVAGNDSRLYHVPLLNEAENTWLNHDIQRIHADPEAVARAAVWHQSTGVFDIPLVTLHNQVDSLVPISQEEALRVSVEKVGNQANLLQRTVPPLTVRIPSTPVSGISHCGFTPAQVTSAWNDLETWVETGRKPQ
jgi:pimeloyl-ACP methyl ester carboxylesterase